MPKQVVSIRMENELRARIEATPGKNLSDKICYLLTKIIEQEETEITFKMRKAILSGYVRHMEPFQKAYPEMFKQMVTDISKEHYETMKTIAFKLDENSTKARELNSFMYLKKDHSLLFNNIVDCIYCSFVLERYDIEHSVENVEHEYGYHYRLTVKKLSDRRTLDLCD